VSIDRLARMAGLGERATQMAIRELIRLGELTIEPNAGVCGWSRYSVLMSHMDRLPMPASSSSDEVPIATRFFVFDRDGWRCAFCGSTEDLTIDHIYPRILGGGHGEDNLQTLCRSCNSRKGARV
jgi:hypothetical protein